MEEAKQVFLTTSAFLFAVLLPIGVFYIIKVIHDFFAWRLLIFQHWKKEQDKSRFPFKEISFHPVPNPNMIKIRIVTKSDKVYEQSLEKEILAD